jgi:histidine triad (HIT) family protein
MGEDCIFCQIVDGDIPSRTVYEDDRTLAFLDANPLAPGHTLVVPKEHHEQLNDLPPALSGAVGETLGRVTDSVEEAVDADGSTVAFNNGAVAGQEVPHVHGHVVPRFEDDGAHPIHSLFGDVPDPSDAELDDVAERVADGIE